MNIGGGLFPGGGTELGFRDEGALSLWRGCSRYDGWSIFAVDLEGGKGVQSLQEAHFFTRGLLLWRRGYRHYGGGANIFSSIEIILGEGRVLSLWRRGCCCCGGGGTVTVEGQISSQV